MKVVNIVKTGYTTYKPVCQFTEEDQLPLQVQEQLLGRQFVIENMFSSKGFWFRIGPVLEQPPVVEKEE